MLPDPGVMYQGLAREAVAEVAAAPGSARAPQPEALPQPQAAHFYMKPL